MASIYLLNPALPEHSHRRALQPQAGKLNPSCQHLSAIPRVIPYLWLSLCSQSGPRREKWQWRANPEFHPRCSQRHCQHPSSPQTAGSGWTAAAPRQPRSCFGHCPHCKTNVRNSVFMSSFPNSLPLTSTINIWYTLRKKRKRKIK